MAAMMAAEAGLSVVVLEAGEFLTPADMVQREEEMLPRLYWDSGGRTTSDRAVKIHQGRGVGGSTLHNLNLVQAHPRVHPRALGATSAGSRKLPAAAWDALYDEVEALLSVSRGPARSLEPAQPPARGGLPRARLGRRRAPPQPHRAASAAASARSAAPTTPRTTPPRCSSRGPWRRAPRSLARCQAIRVRHAGGAVQGVEARALEPRTHRPLGEVIVDAPRVCLSGSATATPALLLRSGVPDRGGETGNHLRIHPAGVVAPATSTSPCAPGRASPRRYECTELLQLDREDGHRVWIVPAFAHPVGTAALVPGHGAPHRALMERYAHLAVLTAMVHDRTRGRVRPDGDLGLSIDYWPDEDDRARAPCSASPPARACSSRRARGASSSRATRPASTSAAPRSRDLERARAHARQPGHPAVHPMGSVPMGDVPSAAVDSEGRHHHLRGLWIADGSLFPSSIGVPPQLSIYALGLHVGRAIARG